jgi:hypothetical protein
MSMSSSATSQTSPRRVPVDDRRAHSPRRHLVLEDLAVRGVVVDDQHVQARGPDPRRRRRRTFVLPGQPEGEGERASPPLLAGHADLAAHELDKLPADGEAQPAAPVDASGRGVGLGERLEQHRAAPRTDPDTGVDDLDAHENALAGVLGHDGAHDDFARLGELHGVAHQIREDLTDAARIPSQCGRHIWIDQGHQLETLGLRLLGQQVGDLLDDDAQIEIDDLEIQLAGLDLGEVQDVADDGKQRLARAANRLRVCALLVAEFGVEQHADHADHAVHRGADLVAHRRQEVRLQPADLHRPVPGGLQLGRKPFRLGGVAGDGGRGDDDALGVAHR